MSAPVSYHDLTCALLRGEAAGWPYGDGNEQVARYLGYLDAQGVQPLVQNCLARSPEYLSWPRPLRLHLDGAVKLYAEIEAKRADEVKKVVGALTREGVVPLLLKGAPLAYTLYSAPHLRTRADTDLLLPVAAAGEAHSVLENLGYHCQPLRQRKYANFQFEAEKSTHGGLQHRFDLHWRINNRMVLASALDYQELLHRSLAIEALGEHARAPALEHSLLIGCLHRAGESSAVRDRLIWLYDIHLLLEALPAEGVERTVALALDRRVGAILRDGWLAALEAFGTKALLAQLEHLRLELDRSPREPSARLLSPSLRGYQERLLEIGALQGWQPKLDFVWESLTPPEEEGGTQPQEVPISARVRHFARRLLGGFRKLLRRSV